MEVVRLDYLPRLCRAVKAGFPLLFPALAAEFLTALTLTCLFTADQPGFCNLLFVLTLGLHVALAVSGFLKAN